jgi:hypothetical protein
LEEDLLNEQRWHFHCGFLVNLDFIWGTGDVSTYIAWVQRGGSNSRCLRTQMIFIWMRVCLSDLSSLDPDPILILTHNVLHSFFLKALLFWLWYINRAQVFWIWLYFLQAGSALPKITVRFYFLSHHYSPLHKIFLSHKCLKLWFECMIFSKIHIGT